MNNHSSLGRWDRRRHPARGRGGVECTKAEAVNGLVWEVVWWELRLDG